MAEMDDDGMELLERRLSERVEERVRSKLIGRFTAIFGVVGAVLGVVGYNFFDQISQIAATHGQNIVDEQVQPNAEKAKIALEQINIQFEVLKKLNERALRDLELVERQVASFAPKAAALEQFSTKVDDIDIRSKELQANLTTAQLTIGSLSELSENLKRLAQQVDQLNALVRADKPATAPPADMARQEAIRGDVQQVIRDTQQVSEQIQTYAARRTVFFQYDGFERGRAEAIVRALNVMGYNAPAADQERITGSGLREIRYYWPADAAVAQDLANAMQGVVRDQGFADQPFTVRDLTGWTQRKPKAGTLEVWFAPPAPAAAR